ncbi:jg18063 [Pararge aegeria aegeria]|uniref:Jg18063 protein n=1 Tax=Pararge aegeria aegeria TaxID=348720 RepID=A0A8S4REF5_9NEOP|nr:jg18063 [Pararge aegeria aegeria]
MRRTLTHDAHNLEKLEDRVLEFELGPPKLKLKSEPGYKTCRASQLNTTLTVFKAKLAHEIFSPREKNRNVSSSTALSTLGGLVEVEISSSSSRQPITSPQQSPGFVPQ